MGVRQSADKYYNIFSPRFWFGSLDLRPLGVMRIAFGAVLFWSTVDLVPVLLSFFSDDGVAPRMTALSLSRPNRVSVFDVAGPEWLTILLFVVTLASIVLFSAGWRTRLTTITTFLLVTGLHERNLYVLDGSDNVLRVMLFWLVFMPSGARYSIDALAREARGEPVVTHGSALPIRMGQIQIAWVYLDTTLYKWPGNTWHDGTALRFALGLDHMFVRPLGQMMFEHRSIVAFGTYMAFATEVLFFPLVFVPLCKPETGPLAKVAGLFQPTWKSLALLAGVAMHFGIAILMSVGNFSLIMVSTYFLLCEPEWVDPLVRFVERRPLWRSLVAGLSAALARPTAVAEGTVPARGRLARLERALASGRVGAQAALHVAVLPLLMLLTMWYSLPEPTKIPPLVLRWHKYTPELDVSPSRMWRPSAQLVEELELWQRWNMFSPRPLDHDIYLMGRGVLQDGTEVDVLRGDRGNGGPIVPPIVPGFLFTRWTKYVSNLVADKTKDAPWVMSFARYVCNEWNVRPPPGRSLLNTFKLYREVHRIPLFGEVVTEGWTEELMWDHQCLPPSAPSQDGQMRSM